MRADLCRITRKKRVEPESFLKSRFDSIILFYYHPRHRMIETDPVFGKIVQEIHQKSTG
jgi:hypothetical protein